MFAVVVLGVVLIVAPLIGWWGARRDAPYYCNFCQRRLIGDPPRHAPGQLAACPGAPERPGMP